LSVSDEEKMFYKIDPRKEFFKTWVKKFLQSLKALKMVSYLYPLLYFPSFVTVVVLSLAPWTTDRIVSQGFFTLQGAKEPNSALPLRQL
jgi:hypothetical protein